MTWKRKWIAALAMLSQVCAPAMAGRYAIRDVTLIDGTGRPALRHRTVLIDKDRIVAMGGLRLPIGKAKVIDGRGKYLIPGMIDTHIHLRDTGPDGKKPVVEVTGSVGNSDEIQASIKAEDWNEYKIVAKGNHLQHFINGTLMSETIDNQKDKAATTGILALQAHAGPPMTVQFKDLRIKELK